MMKYKNILSTGHPRSGTHYITALISVNFLDDTDYFKIYRNHELPDLVEDPDFAYLHIWRDFKAVSRSIYVLKERFGLDVDSYGQFLKRRYSDMWRVGDPDKVVTNANNLYGQAKIKGVSDFFKDVNMRPREFWEHYNGVWERCAEGNPNVVSVKYDDMINNFQSTMAYLASRLGSGLMEFKNIDRKVGWWK